MTVGMAAASANSILDTQLPNTRAFQLHTADPGAAGTTAVSSTTTRVLGTWNTASAASKALSGASVWPAWAGTNGEVVTHVSVWTATTAGTFIESAALSASKTMATGDILSLGTYTRTITPIAA
jgi:hypothetical protein